MSTSVPRFELTHVNSDGSSEPPQIVPFTAIDLNGVATDRRGFLATGLTAGAMLAAIGAASGCSTRERVKPQSPKPEPKPQPQPKHLDLSKEPPSVKGSTYSIQNAQGQTVTYTLPCGSPIPAGAVCTCNCVPGSYVAPKPRTRTHTYSYCSCNKVCTCVPVYSSDRDAKACVQSVSGGDILASLADLPVVSWTYWDDAQGSRHIGPMAQDFYAAFRLGDSERHIHVADGIGVALAAIQELHRLAVAQQEEIARLRQALAMLNTPTSVSQPD